MDLDSGDSGRLGVPALDFAKGEKEPGGFGEALPAASESKVRGPGRGVGCLDDAAGAAALSAGAGLGEGGWEGATDREDGATGSGSGTDMASAFGVDPGLGVPLGLGVAALALGALPPHKLEMNPAPLDSAAATAGPAKEEKRLLFPNRELLSAGFSGSLWSGDEPQGVVPLSMFPGDRGAMTGERLDSIAGAMVAGCEAGGVGEEIFGLAAAEALWEDGATGAALGAVDGTELFLPEETRDRDGDKPKDRDVSACGGGEDA